MYLVQEPFELYHSGVAKITWESPFQVLQRNGSSTEPQYEKIAFSQGLTKSDFVSKTAIWACSRLMTWFMICFSGKEGSSTENAKGAESSTFPRYGGDLGEDSGLYSSVISCKSFGMVS